VKRRIPIGAPGRKRDAGRKTGGRGKGKGQKSDRGPIGGPSLDDPSFDGYGRDGRAVDARPQDGPPAKPRKLGSRRAEPAKQPTPAARRKPRAATRVGSTAARAGSTATRDAPTATRNDPAANPVSAQSPSTALSIFAITAPGLEQITAAELRAIGIASPVVEPGGVAFTGTLDDVYRANLWLRTASRVVIRIASFHASEFHELERRAKRVAWDRYIGVPARVRFRVTCRKSRLYHSDAVAERLARTIEQTHGLAGGFAIAGADEGAGAEETTGRDDAQLFIVRLVNDEVTISADSSGELLHRRGYRQAVVKAPLRETLAAAMLVGAGWDPGAPLADPMCGSGTIPIEAAMVARGMAPGIDHVQQRSRPFAFMRWGGFDDRAWSERIIESMAAVRASAPSVIIAADRDAGAITAALANAERAGVAADIELRQGAISALELPNGPGCIVSNPPYGVRVGETAALRNLYAQLGKVMRDRGHGWTLALLTADRVLERQVGVRFEEVFRASNGGIPVRLVRALID
jgi:putative N6-adenine-specific DNA methylase